MREASDQPIYLDADKLDFEDDTLLKLPKGVKVKVLAVNKEKGWVDMLVKFPPSYYEPLHTHEGWHSVVILKGTVETPEGVLKEGDYIYGPSKTPHGPFKWGPNGTIVFVHFEGDPTHIYDEARRQQE